MTCRHSINPIGLGPSLMRSIRALITFLLSLQVVGCTTVGPDYVPPELQTPKMFSSELTGGLRAAPEDNTTLSQWTTLKDPELNTLIERAVEGNLDLRQAAARIREARAQRGISEADRFPTIDASGSVAQKRFRFGTNQDNVLAATTSYYQAGFDASWEIDLFGRLQRQVESSVAEFQATEEEYRDILVTLLAEVALNHVEVRSFQTRIAVARANQDVQAKTFDLVLVTEPLQWR
ncbi:MAG: hypothetical protein NPIRA03_37170 [Nitrospirales bacterium]|nr:MAG: hypothetical protein NPIRA03_37170 [Nitrospirales bacterium]